jgi:hypothetical protein
MQCSLLQALKKETDQTGLGELRAQSSGSADAEIYVTSRFLFVRSNEEAESADRFDQRQVATGCAKQFASFYRTDLDTRINTPASLLSSAALPTKHRNQDADRGANAAGALNQNSRT